MPATIGHPDAPTVAGLVVEARRRSNPPVLGDVVVPLQLSPPDWGCLRPAESKQFGANANTREGTEGEYRNGE